MADYYAVLTRKIQETSDDPAKMREVVYEAARLALRWQVQEQWPQLSITQSKRQMSELEDAIARLEAGATNPGGLGKTETSNAVAGFKATQQDLIAPDETEEDDPPGVVEESDPQPREPPSAEMVGLEAVAGSLGGR